MTKAIFFDIDGTLVSFETHGIPASTVETIAAAHARGIKMFIATGRAPGFINNLGDLQSRGLIDGYVTMNGGYCYVDDKVIHKQVIPAAEVKAHFVVVTGLENEYLQVSSWGKEYYISWQEYLHYAGKCSSFLVSNICMLYEKRRKKDRREKERGAL